MVINTNPSTQQHTIVLVCIIAPIFSSLFTAIRVGTRIFIIQSIGWDDCKSTHRSLLKTSLSRNTDAAIVTLVMLTTVFAHSFLLMKSKKPFCIAFSVLVSLGMLAGPWVRTSSHQALGTNYGFGWHTADVPSDWLSLYYKVQDYRHLL